MAGTTIKEDASVGLQKGSGFSSGFGVPGFGLRCHLGAAVGRQARLVMLSLRHSASVSFRFDRSGESRFKIKTQNNIKIAAPRASLAMTDEMSPLRCATVDMEHTFGA